MVRQRLAPALTARWTISFTSIVHFERGSSILRNGDYVGRRLIGRILVFHWRIKKKDLPPLDWRGCLSEDDENMAVMSAAQGARVLLCRGHSARLWSWSQGWFGDLPRSEARSGDAHATLAPKRRAKLPVAAVASGGADSLAETLHIRRSTYFRPCKSRERDDNGERMLIL
ncbi:hypothetical protein KC356_g226 [Hortaea werneckii]|nr:hypothetical protein KC356_g226 [Hortaea werneckii]